MKEPAVYIMASRRNGTLYAGVTSDLIQRAWQLGAARVWVHTCVYDHPAALANYEARGMRVYKIEDQY